MRLLVVLLFFFLTLQATTLLNIQVVEKKEGTVDILLGFDIPFDGAIRQSAQDGEVKILLSGVLINQPYSKKITSASIYQIDLIPGPQGLEVILYTVDKIAVSAFKSSDGFGMKLTAAPALAPSEPSSGENPFYARVAKSAVLFVAAGLTLGFLGILYWLSTRRRSVKKKNILSFDHASEPISENTPESITILLQKAIDDLNSAVLLEYRGIKYLAVIGTSNLLLDRFGQNESIDEVTFEQIIENHQRALGAKLKFESRQFENYKEKASQEFEPTEKTLDFLKSSQG